MKNLCSFLVQENESKRLDKKELEKLYVNVIIIEKVEAWVQNFKEKYKTNKKLIEKLDNNIESMMNLYNYRENIRKIIYTTNEIELVNSILRKVTNWKQCFVNRESLKRCYI